MLRRFLFLLTATFLILPMTVRAQIYEWKDIYGSTHYSDISHSGATRVQLGSTDVVHNSNFDLTQRSTSIPYRDIRGQIHVQGLVNGVPIDFVVDTGASLIVIPQSAAKRAGISTDNAPTERMQTANGITNSPVVEIANFSLGSLRAKNINAVVHNIDSEGRIGLLGMDFLGDYKMTIDHEHSMLVLLPR